MKAAIIPILAFLVVSAKADNNVPSPEIMCTLICQFANDPVKTANTCRVKVSALNSKMNVLTAAQIRLLCGGINFMCPSGTTALCKAGLPLVLQGGVWSELSTE